MFHVDGQLELTISVYEFGTNIVYEQCLCAMFGFQRDSLHISKDVAYDSNTVFSTLYQISMASVQGKQWVVTSS
jgi:hypothetical protein